MGFTFFWSADQLLQFFNCLSFQWLIWNPDVAVSCLLSPAVAVSTLILCCCCSLDPNTVRTATIYCYRRKQLISRPAGARIGHAPSLGSCLMGEEGPWNSWPSFWQAGTFSALGGTVRYRWPGGRIPGGWCYLQMTPFWCPLKGMESSRFICCGKCF